MLTNTLNTNEIKDSAGAENEFTRLSIGDRSTIYAVIGENPALPHRLSISHSESGSGVSRRRRSVVRFDKSAAGNIDATRVEKASAYIVYDYPVGNVTSDTLGKIVLANLLSFCATTGAATTVLFDCTGNGAVCLVSGGI